MSWSDKFKSRKFILALGTFLSALSVIFFEVEIPSEIMIGAAGVLIAYMGAQGWVDKSIVQGQADVMKNETLLQAQAYIKYLEAELQKYAPPVEDNVSPFPPAQ